MDWKRVSRSLKCRVCLHDDWCVYTGSDNDPSAAICMRIASDRQLKNGGWLHKLKNDDWQRQPRTWTVKANRPPPAANMETLAWQCMNDMTSARFNALATRLGVSVASLYRLQVGWKAENHTYTWPMTVNSQIVGIRLRSISGRKWSISGSQEGLFVPADLHQAETLYICEGATDTTAALTLGLMAVGRPSCTGGTRHVVELCRRVKPDKVCVLADSDQVGQQGANALANSLLPYVRSIRVITPPAKDLREWIALGATAADVQRLATAAVQLTLRFAKAVLA